MLYILKSDYPEQANWHNDFSIGLVESLLKVGYPDILKGTEAYIPPQITENDYLFVTHYADLDSLAVRNTKAKVIFHHHGSAVSPYMHYVDRKAEIEQVMNVIDINTFCLPTQAKHIITKYNLPKDKCATIGFPLDFSKYEKYKKPKKKKIVVGGHIGPERQCYLATYLLKDLIPEYEVVFSIVEKPNCVTGKWSSFYDLQRFIDMGFRFVLHPDQEGFYQELSDASHVFTCSLGDVISISIVEGYLCGCYPVVPWIENYWPMFSDYISTGYDSFCKQSVEEHVRRKDESIGLVVNLDWFTPSSVGKRLLAVLGE